MSSNAKKAKDKKATPTVVPHDEQWRSGRSRFGRQNFRFGKDKEWHFAGQQPDETVTKIVREHWWFLVLSALPLLGALILLLLIVWASVKLANPIWPFLEIIAVIFIAGTLGWFIWKDFIKWYLNTYIITNKRIVHSGGVLEPTRNSIPLEKVKQVGIDLDTLWGFMLRYGTVHVYLTGGDLVMERIPRPRKVKDAIDGISESIKAKKPKEEKPPTPDNPEVAAVIEGLSKAKEPPALENADEKLIQRNPHGRLGPRRTFGGILRIPCDVHYTSGEFTVKYIQRSQYVLYRQIAIPLVALCLVLFLAFYTPTLSLPFKIANLSQWWESTGVITLLLILSMGAMYTNYADDVFILTNKRIIDIRRRFIFFFEGRRELEYKNIKNLRVRVPSLPQRLLDIGDVYIEVAGAPGIILPTIDHPFYILDKINEIKDHAAKADAIKKENDQKKELHNWFAKVATSLVENTQTKGAPNLENKDLIDAMEVASALGFQVAVSNEEPSKSKIPPGRVIRQNPPAGTVIQPGGMIQVVLSRKATTTELLNY